jgi:hypothetical protein
VRLVEGTAVSATIVPDSASDLVVTLNRYDTGSDSGSATAPTTSVGVGEVTVAPSSGDTGVAAGGGWFTSMAR